MPHHEQQQEQLQAREFQDRGRVAMEATEAYDQQYVQCTDGHNDDRHPECNLGGPAQQSVNRLFL